MNVSLHDKRLIICLLLLFAYLSLNKMMNYVCESLTFIGWLKLYKFIEIYKIFRSKINLIINLFWLKYVTHIEMFEVESNINETLSFFFI